MCEEEKEADSDDGEADCLGVPMRLVKTQKNSPFKSLGINNDNNHNNSLNVAQVATPFKNGKRQQMDTNPFQLKAVERSSRGRNK